MGRYDFSGIRSYSELESSIRMIHNEVETSNLSQQVSHFKATGGPTWEDIALFVIGVLRKRLAK